MQINNKEWKPVIIDGEYTPYIASIYGNVYNTVTDHMMTASPAPGSKRPRMCLRWNGHKKDMYVYKIIYEAFNGPVPKDMSIDHIDENFNNNCLSNLQLLTPSENIKKFYRLHPERGFQPNYPDELIIKMLKRCKVGEYVVDVAKDLGIPTNLARSILNGRRRKVLYDIYKPYPESAYSRKKLTEDDKNYMKSLILDGVSSKSILKEMDLAYDAYGLSIINELRKDLGIPIETIIDDKLSNEIESMIIQGLSNKEIYKVLNIDWSEKLSWIMVRKRRRLGIPDRKYNIPKEEYDYIKKSIEEGKNNKEILKPIGKYDSPYYRQFCNDLRYDVNKKKKLENSTTIEKQTQ